VFCFCVHIGLFSAILQSSARSIALPIDQLKFSYQVLDNDEEHQILESLTVSFDGGLLLMVYVCIYSQRMILRRALLLMESIWMVRNGIVNNIRLWIAQINDEPIVYHLCFAN
jgi:hypothetical protein